MDCTSWTKCLEYIFRILYNCIWIGSRMFSLLRREYLSSAVNVLTMSPKGENISNRDFFHVYLANCQQKVWRKLFHADLISIWFALRCSPSEGALKWGYPNIRLTIYLTVYNFINTLAMNIIFFFKMLKIWWRFQKWKEKLRICF